MENIIGVLTENIELIAGVVGILIAIATIGRKRAFQLILRHLEEAKADLLQNMDSFAGSYAKYLYAKLPKTARAFLTVKRIEKLILKFAKEIEGLDSK